MAGTDGSLLLMVIYLFPNEVKTTGLGFTKILCEYNIFGCKVEFVVTSFRHQDSGNVQRFVAFFLVCVRVGWNILCT